MMTDRSSLIDKLLDIEEYCNHITDVYIEGTFPHSIVSNILDIIKEQ